MNRLDPGGKRLMMRGFLISAIIAATAACSTAPVRHAAPRSQTVGIAAPLLAEHNRERASFGAPPVVWDSAVAASATAHAAQLARLGRLQHSSRNVRPGQGENLWIGTRGAFGVDTMARDWASERRFFRSGRFPATSRSGNWADAGHYTQMVWPTTQRLGCGLARSARWDVLVCRYWPAGNIDGVTIGRS